MFKTVVAHGLRCDYKREIVGSTPIQGNEIFSYLGFGDVTKRGNQHALPPEFNRTECLNSGFLGSPYLLYAKCSVKLKKKKILTFFLLQNPNTLLHHISRFVD